MPPRDWRVAADYEALDDLDMSGLAWEFLRRNPQYQSDYLSAVRARDSAEPEAGGGLPTRWGLRFPG